MNNKETIYDNVTPYIEQRVLYATHTKKKKNKNEPTILSQKKKHRKFSTNDEKTNEKCAIYFVISLFFRESYSQV